MVHEDCWRVVTTCGRSVSVVLEEALEQWRSRVGAVEEQWMTARGGAALEQWRSSGRREHCWGEQRGERAPGVK